jgi:peptide/nickel transport system permease protein
MVSARPDGLTGSLPRGSRQRLRDLAWFTGSAGLVLLVAIVIAIALGPQLSGHDPETIDPGRRLQSPSFDNWFGTDDLGRDVFSRIVHGGRTSLLVSAGVLVVAITLGSLLGLLSGYFRRLDGPIMRIMDGIMAFPGVLLAIAVITGSGPGLASVVLALSLVSTPVVGRHVRGMTLQIKELPFVEAARCIGVSDRAILWRYIFRNATSPLVVQATAVVASAILAEASLSYLGAGIDPEAPSWGGMLRDGQRLVDRAWWLVLAPGAALFLSVLALNLVGDALRDALDPQGTKPAARNSG